MKQIIEALEEALKEIKIDPREDHDVKRDIKRNVLKAEIALDRLKGAKVLFSNENMSIINLPGVSDE